ncbi:MAG: hypothetical protein WAK30_18340, partial [Candidatus Acidiferrales bacterium]
MSWLPRLSVNVRNESALRSPRMGRHQLRRLYFHTMNWTLTGSRCLAAFVLTSIVIPARLLRVMLQRQQSLFGLARRLQCFARDRIDVVTPSN